MESWVAEETAAADLGDTRLNQRLGIVLNRLGDKPGISIPAASKGWAEIQAAYRFFSNDKVTMEKILGAHKPATLERIKSHTVVLLVNDTTQLNYVVERKKEGFGTIRTQERTRYHLHPTIALTPDRVCLGTVTAKFWQRPEETEGHLRKQKEIEDKESIRWLESYEKACEISRQAPQTLIVSVGDRESDIYEYYQLHAQLDAGQRAQWLVRAASNRRVVTGGGTKSNLWNTMSRAPRRGIVSFELSPSSTRKARTVTQVIRSKSVVFDGVQRKGRRLPPLKVNVVYAKERDVPKGETPVTWMLLTSVPVESFEQCQEVIRWYSCRWGIGVSGEGHINQSVKVRPRSRDSGLVAWEAPWRESKAVEPSDPYTLGVPQRTRLQRAVNVEVASSHAFPVAETVYNARKQQGLIETSPKRQLSPAGYQRRHGAKVCVSTGETLGARRRNLVEEVHPITVSGKWMGRHQGGGSGCNTVDRRATKRAGREGPGPVGISLVQGEAGAR